MRRREDLWLYAQELEQWRPLTYPQETIPALLAISVALCKTAQFLKSAPSSKMWAGMVSWTFGCHTSADLGWGKRSLLQGKGRANSLPSEALRTLLPSFRGETGEKALVHSFSLVLWWRQEATNSSCKGPESEYPQLWPTIWSLSQRWQQLQMIWKQLGVAIYGLRNLDFIGFLHITKYYPSFDCKSF